MKIFGFTTHGGADVASVFEVPEPTPGPGQVLIEMLATAVNPGDLATREGTNSFQVTYPMAMGREAAGRVLALGAGVNDLSPGDLVFGSTATGHGSFGEQVLLDSSSTTPVPAGLDVVAAACIPVAYGTAQDVLDHLGLRRGQTLVVIGAGGGVGTAVTSLARARGVQIVGVASGNKQDVVTRLGGRYVESGAGWTDRVRELGKQPDAVFDLVGGEVLDEAITLVESVANVVSVADPQRVPKPGGGGIARRRTREVFGEVARILAAGEAEVTISRRYPLSEAAAAVDAVERGHAEGKVAVTSGS